MKKILFALPVVFLFAAPASAQTGRVVQVINNHNGTITEVYSNGSTYTSDRDFRVATLMMKQAPKLKE